MRGLHTGNYTQVHNAFQVLWPDDLGVLDPWPEDGGVLAFEGGRKYV